jgi:hypothetical protein
MCNDLLFEVPNLHQSIRAAQGILHLAKKGFPIGLCEELIRCHE